MSERLGSSSIETMRPIRLTWLYQLPSDRAVPLGVNRGKPVVLDDEDCDFARALLDLAKAVLPKPEAPKKRSLLRPLAKG